MLCDEHGMAAVGRLLAVVSRLGRREPAFDQLLRVLAHYGDPAQVNDRSVSTAEAERGPEVVLTDPT